MMNPAHLDLFRAVMRHGGMTRAGEVLGIGQPHISRAIAQLEAALGFALFVRGHGNAFPTPEGEAFAQEVAQTYAGLDHLQQAARRIRERGTGGLRVACQPSLAAGLLPRAIRRLDAECPDLRISVHVPSPDTIWSWTASGQCDLGLARPRSGHAGVSAEPFLRVAAVCALPRGHALVRRRVVTAADLAGVPLIAAGSSPVQAATEAAFASAGATPRFALMAEYTAARCGLVAEGLGAAIVDPVPARALGGLPIVLRPFRPEIPIETLLLRPAGRPPGRLVERLMLHLAAERDALVAA
ncbi:MULTISPECIES: LysR family transcriptional regulator [Methylobacterium]|uniref:LysR family transcriptional regulator n=1 Tax=Methylobacterium TaxID=407 RepID=UPI00034B5FE1|nr:MULTISPECIES: LysR family transcriptional regulator [Methylobacterium]MBN4092991.1 LysR family transcriptional regulator [Methylobacterium sp. OT2]UIN34601.1 LysR family transcriptional regulator [Methylobacterium oryzae]SEF80030.1 DNA-binding transcriptional regulator, LysR family [Methylobacterium sp. 190mf]